MVATSVVNVTFLLWAYYGAHCLIPWYGGFILGMQANRVAQVMARS